MKKKKNLSEVKKGNKKQKSKDQKMHCIILKCFTKQEKLKATKGKGLKILTSEQMLPRLPIALEQVKAGNISESLLNEIRKIVYSLYQSKEITKKVYNSIIKSI